MQDDVNSLHNDWSIGLANALEQNNPPKNEQINLHAKGGLVSSLQLKDLASPVPANSTVAMSRLTMAPLLIKWMVQKEGSELISSLLLTMALSSLLLVAVTCSTYTVQDQDL